MVKKVVANSKRTAKKPPGKPWQKGQSGNPSGRPKDGESWASVIKAVSNMDVDEILTFVGKDNDLGRQVAKLPRNVQVKYLVTARVVAALMFEPTSGLWNGLMDRAEGKVKEKVDVTSNGQSVNLSDDERATRITEILDAIRARRAGQSSDAG